MRVKTKDQILLENAYADVARRNSKIPGYQNELENIKQQADDMERERNERAAGRRAEMSSWDEQDKDANAKHEAEMANLQSQRDALRQNPQAGLLKPGTPEYEAHMKKLLSLGYKPKDSNQGSLEGDEAAHRAEMDKGEAAHRDRMNALRSDGDKREAEAMQRLRDVHKTSMDQIARSAGQATPAAVSQQQAPQATGGEQPKARNFDAKFGIPLTDKGMAAWGNLPQQQKDESIANYKQYVKSVLAKDDSLSPIMNSPVAAKILGL